jgi:hypothetical protein
LRHPAAGTDLRRQAAAYAAHNNSMIVPTDRAIAGVTRYSNMGGSLDLSRSPPPAALRQNLDMIQLFNGALTSDLTVTVPNLSKLWWFQNSTPGAFNLYVKTPSGAAPPNLVQIPQGLGVMVMCDGASNLKRHDDNEIGDFKISGKSSPGPGELAPTSLPASRASFRTLLRRSERRSARPIACTSTSRS